MPSRHPPSIMILMVRTPHPYVGTHEIGEMLGVSRQRVFQITSRRDFPKPYDELRMGKLWRRMAVETWMREHGRNEDDPPAS